MGLSARERLLLGISEMWICCSLPVSFLPVQVKKPLMGQGVCITLRIKLGKKARPL